MATLTLTPEEAWRRRVLAAACDQDGNWWRRVEAVVKEGRPEWQARARGEACDCTPGPGQAHIEDCPAWAPA